MNIEITLVGILIILIGTAMIIFRKRLENILYMHSPSFLPSENLATGWAISGFWIIIFGIIFLVAGLFY